MKTPSKTRIEALITYLEQPMPLDLACEYAMVDPAWVYSAFEAAMNEDGTELAAHGERIKAAQATAAGEQIGAMLSKSRKDWKANAALLQLLDARFQPKSGLKELGEGLGSALKAVIELPARENPHLIDLPPKNEE